MYRPGMVIFAVFRWAAKNPKGALIAIALFLLFLAQYNPKG
jgi:hypothetical protein